MKQLKLPKNPAIIETLPSTVRKEYERSGPNCSIYDVAIKRLTDFFDVFSSVSEKQQETFWFRGHADLSWSIKPSALRYNTKNERNRALNLVATFKRYAEMKLERPPSFQEELKWVQLAQHYGLPTRLLDWTENAAVALYFTCNKHHDKNGLILILNPVDLNKQMDPNKPRIFDTNKDQDLINEYLKLDGIRDPKNGLDTIAINPSWNSERIMAQKGVFTLHGSRNFSLNRTHAPSLVYVPILKEYKQILIEELDQFGISEIIIYPEIEHLCSYLKTKAGLS